MRSIAAFAKQLGNCLSVGSGLGEEAPEILTPYPRDIIGFSWHVAIPPFRIAEERGDVSVQAVDRLLRYPRGDDDAEPRRPK